jgi:hypothetical protein
MLIPALLVGAEKTARIIPQRAQRGRAGESEGTGAVRRNGKPPRRSGAPKAPPRRHPWRHWLSVARAGTCETSAGKNRAGVNTPAR